MLGASAAIGKVVDLVKSFAGTAQNLSFLARETGLSINLLRQYEAAADRVGMSSSAMDDNIKGLNESLNQLRSGRFPVTVRFLRSCRPTCAPPKQRKKRSTRFELPLRGLRKHNVTSLLKLCQSTRNGRA